jgi:hypothetical protein
MKGKQQKKEEIDLSTLPKANMVVSSLMLNFKNPDNKLKFFENFYKGLQNDPLYFFITREHIIDYAKEQKIYEDLSDPKAKNPKDAPPQPKKDITPSQLSKACLGLLIEKSIPCRKDKKVIYDQIDEALKKREESEKYWKNKESAGQGQPVEAPKEEKKKKGKDKKKQVETEITPPKPEEIEIPKYDEYTNEMFVILYNYPLSEEEYDSLINETNEQNDHIIINLFQFINDIDEYVEPKKEEVVLDKKGKPVQKEAKLDKDAAEMQRYFTSTLVLPPHPKSPETIKAEQEAKKKAEEEAKKKEEEAKSNPKQAKKVDKNAAKAEVQEEIDDGMEPTPLILDDVYNSFLKQRDNSTRDSNMRKACFNKEDFSYKITNEAEKEDTASLFYKNFLVKLAKIHAQMVYFEEWKKNYEIIKLEDEGETVETYDIEKIKNINSENKFGNDSIGRVLINFAYNLIKEKRIDERNQLLFYMNSFEKKFAQNFEKYRYDFIDNNKENTDEIIPLQSHPKLLLEKGDKKIERDIKKCDENSSPFKTLINYHDIIYKENLEEKVGNHYVLLIQKNFNLFLSNPLLDKCLYVYYNKNNADLIQQFGKNNEIYALLKNKGISYYIYDKYYDLNFFEKMLKENVPEHSFNLGERIYEEIYNKDLFRQELNQIILYDYECCAKLDERNQKTMLAFYYRCPKGRVYRKQKKYRYLSQPGLQAFIEMFCPEFILDNSTNINKDKKDAKDAKKDPKKPATDKTNPEEGKKGYRFIINEKKEENKMDNLPLYYADDIKVGNISEQTKYMFPSDDGVFIKKVLKNGIYSSPISYIRKDNLVFGIKKDNEIKEFWLNFEDGLKLNVSYKSEYNSLFKNSETPKVSNEGCVTSLTLNDGLVIHIEPNGDIIQKHYKNESNEDNETIKENYRLISSKASVIRYMENGEINILYSTGNTSEIKEGKIYNINNKGQKTIKDSTTGEIEKDESVFFTEHYDPESLSRTIVREDNVKTIIYPDNSRIALHNEGTKIYSSPIIKELNHYTIENSSFATVEIYYDEVKKRTQTTIAAGSTEALIGSDNLMNRTYDGRLVKIILPDKTLVYVYKEKQSTELFETYMFNTIIFIYKLDGDVIRISQSGDIVIVSSNERKKLNDEGMNKDFEKGEDLDYYFEVNGKPEERKGGIYTCELNNGKIWTKDKETNIFVQLASGDNKCKIEGTTIAEMNEKTIEEIEPHSPRYEGDWYIDPETRFSDTPKNFYEPRIFVIDNKTFEAKEYLSERQIENFKRNMVRNKENVYYTQKKNEIDGSLIHQWIEKILPENEKYKKIQKLEKEVKIPNRYIPLSQTVFRSPYPEKEIYLTRKLRQTPKITQNLRQEIESIDNDFTINVRNKQKQEIEKVSYDIIKMNRIIQRRYIKERMEKNNEEKKEGKEGDLVYKSEVSDFNTINIPSNINEIQKSTSSKIPEINTDIKKESENNEKTKEDNENINNKGNRYMNM